MNNQRMEQVRDIWGDDCSVYGPKISKDGSEYVIAVVKDDTDFDLYLYDMSGSRNYDCCLFAELGRDKLCNTILRIVDIQIAEINCNNGLASILMEFVLEYAANMNIKRIIGELSPVDSEHFDRSEKFYSKHGFKVKFNDDRSAGYVYRDM